MVKPWVWPEELGDQSHSPYALEACQTATFIVWAFSGRKYSGAATVTETYECPCRVMRRDEFIGGGFAATPMLVNGNVSNLLATRSGCDCGPMAHARLRLRGRPVRRVLKVVQGGVTLGPEEYLLINQSILQGAPGSSFEPCGATITYSYGAEPPVAGKRAVRHMAQQFVLGWEGSEDCQLPDRVTSISRQGVSYTLLDEQSFLDDLRTGIYSVDLFLRAVNPDRARKPARILTPDMPTVARRSRRQPEHTNTTLMVTPGTGLTWEMDLSDVDASFMLDPEWTPTAQIMNGNGIIRFVATEASFAITDTDTIVFTMSPTDTLSIVEDGYWELYARNDDTSTLVNVLIGNVYLN